MKRKCDENIPPATPVPLKKKRGPYKQWVLNDSAMPSSTKSSRKLRNVVNVPKIPTVSKNYKRIPDRKIRRQEPKTNHGFVDGLQLQREPVVSVHSDIIQEMQITENYEPPVINLCPAVEPHIIANVDCQPLTSLDPPLSFCEKQPEPDSQQTDLLSVNEHEEVDDPLFSEVEEFSADEGEGDDVHSEDSFILHFAAEDNDESVEEIECEPDVNNPTFQLPSPPMQNPMPDDDSSDEEVVDAEASSVNLTIEEKIRLLLLLATSKRHNLSYSAAEDILELANVLGHHESFSLSRHVMKTVIKNYSCALTVHHMCPSCESYVGIVQNTSFQCAKCMKRFSTDANKKKQNIFLYLSLTDQLEALVKSYSDKLVDPCKRDKINEHNLEDIYDGKVYKRMFDGGLTISFFVDGLQVASTSKRSAWPILCCVNELPLSIRRKSVLMASLWLSLKKPNCNEYMKPFVTECLELERRGISVRLDGEVNNMKVTVIIGISDTIARPLLRNSIQFNGMFGCGFCLHPGIRMKYQRGYIRSYSTRERDFPRRTHTQLMEFARTAANRQNGIPCRGIKGLSVLSQLPNFDMVVCLDLDLFHALVNVSKRFAHLWFLKKFRGKAYNIFSKFEEVNKRLLQITPTSDVSRAPRSMKERSDFRGHEWFHWVFEYSIPVLKNLLPARFLNHWALLVHGIALLMQNSVARSEMVYAGRYLSSFVADVDVLYGKAHVTFSMHLLTHLKESVNNFGQPWAHSAFVFESFNAEIKRAVKSSNGVAYQICSAMQRKIALRKLEDEVGEYLSDQQKNYLDKMNFTVHRLAEPTLTLGPASLMGNSKEVVFPIECLSAARRAGLQCGDQTKFKVYDRCQVYGQVYQSTKYSRAFRQNNSVCMLESNEVFLIESFFVYNNECFVLGNILERSRAKLCDVNLPHIILLKDEPECMTRCLPARNIQFKLLSFIVESTCGSVRVACINVLENEMLR